MKQAINSTQHFSAQYHKEVTTGRYVKVMIKGAEYLTLAEVQVFSPGMSEHSERQVHKYVILKIQVCIRIDVKITRKSNH
jgi:hypothetical protein